MAGIFSASAGFVKSLYNDGFRWQIVKSVALFGVGIYVANEMEAALAEGLTPTIA